ncbi:hypothetical protein ACU9CO_000605 [Cronobacter dublinensis]
MSEYFLLTYSVHNVGSRWDQDKAEDVRNSIHDLTLSSIIDLDDEIHRPFYIWEKLSSVETTIKGLIDVGNGSLSSKRSKAVKAFDNLFVRLLKDKKAKANTTVVHCALLVNELDEVQEFTVSY